MKENFCPFPQEEDSSQREEEYGARALPTVQGELLESTPDSCCDTNR